jgi:hypothetical protein
VLRWIVSLALWLAAIAVTWHTLTRGPAQANVADFLPATGVIVDTDSIWRAFGLDDAPGEALILALTSNCSVCLALDTKLRDLRESAECRRIPLVPLIAELGISRDSMVGLLWKNGIRTVGHGAISDMQLLQVRAVPTAIHLRNGRVITVSNPALRDSWPLDRC